MLYPVSKLAARKDNEVWNIEEIDKVE